MKLKKNWITLTLAVLLLVLAGFNIGYFGYDWGLSDLFNKESFQVDSNIFFAEDDSRINEIIEANKELNLTKKIYESCADRLTSADKLYCVNDYVKENYNYRYVGNEVYTIEEMFENGADCKSYAFYYATLADMMGFEYTFIVIRDDHVATIVPLENGYCLLDQSVGVCIGY